MVKRYSVDTSNDDVVELRDVLGVIANSAGRVISVTWQPARRIVHNQTDSVAPPRFTIVSEYDD